MRLYMSSPSDTGRVCENKPGRLYEWRAGDFFDAFGVIAWKRNTKSKERYGGKMSDVVIGFAKTKLQARNIICFLKSADVPPSDISLLFQARACNSFCLGKEESERVRDETLLNEFAAYVLDTKTIQLARLGPVYGIGPLMILLRDTDTHGLSQMLVESLGCAEDLALECAAKTELGTILIAVHCHSAEETRIVEGIFRYTYAEAITLSGEHAPLNKRDGGLDDRPIYCV